MAELATEYQWQLATQEDDLILKKLSLEENEIIHLTDAERNLFKVAVKPVLEKYEKIIPASIFQMFQDQK